MCTVVSDDDLMSRYIEKEKKEEEKVNHVNYNRII
jgi:hypothetical protein